MATTPKSLRKISDGRIFAYTEALAKRSDMVAVWGEGEEPEIEIGTGGGLEVDPSDFDRKTKKLLGQMEKKLLATEKALNEVVMEKQELLDRVSDLEAQLVEFGVQFDVPETKAEEKAPLENLSPEERMELLTAATMEIIKDDDPDNFTGAEMPRIGPLETFSGVAEVTAEERNDAYHAAKEAMKAE